jgi:serine/threonine-protein kinase
LGAALQVTEALAAAHETVYTDELGFEVRGILHGDVKPANILVSRNDEVKLFDFLLVDIQRLLDPRVVPAEYTAKPADRPLTMACGTPGFMAPEQEESGLITVRTDIFGLGVTLCYLFEPEEQNWIAVLNRNELPVRLRDLLRMMTSRSACARPKSVNAVLEDLWGIYCDLCERHHSRIIDRLHRWYTQRFAQIR